MQALPAGMKKPAQRRAFFEKCFLLTLVLERYFHNFSTGRQCNSRLKQSDIAVKMYERLKPSYSARPPFINFYCLKPKPVDHRLTKSLVFNWQEKLSFDFQPNHNFFYTVDNAFNRLEEILFGIKSMR